MPTVACWPGKVAAGSETDHISAFWDVLPTMAELTGQTLPKPTDGISMLPTLLGKTGQKQHDYLYWEFHEKGGRQALRQGQWKAVRYDVAQDADSLLELYDLVADPGEARNIASEHPEKIAELAALIKGARTVSPVEDFNFPKKTSKVRE